MKFDGSDALGANAPPLRAARGIPLATHPEPDCPKRLRTPGGVQPDLAPRPHSFDDDRSK